MFSSQKRDNNLNPAAKKLNFTSETGFNTFLEISPGSGKESHRSDVRIIKYFKLCFVE